MHTTASLLKAESFRAMFPLSFVCVCVCAQAHTRNQECTKVSSKNVFSHISYTLFQIQMRNGKMLKKITCAHRLKKLEGTLLPWNCTNPFSPLLLVIWKSEHSDIILSSEECSGIQHFLGISCNTDQTSTVQYTSNIRKTKHSHCLLYSGVNRENDCVHCLVVTPYTIICQKAMTRSFTLET